MLGILELQEQRELAVKNAEDIVKLVDSESRDMTEDEGKRYDAFIAERKALDVNIARRKELAAAKADISKPEERKTVSAQPQTAELNFKTITPARSAIRLRAMKTPDDAHLMGKWIMGSLFGDVDARLHCQKRGLEFRAQSEGVNTKGGFLVPEVMENAIIDTRAKYGIWRQNAVPKTMSSDTMLFPVKASGLTPYFVGENTEITESSQGWTNVELRAKKLACLAKYSSELSEDAVISLADDLANDMGMAFAEYEDRCGFIGDGTSTYGGMRGLVTWFETYDASGTGYGVSVAATNHDTYAEYDAADIGAFLRLLPQQYRAGAKLYMSSVTWSAVLERLMIAAGGNTIANVSESVPARYLGYPVVISELLLASATVTTDHSNKSVMLFGNLPMASLMGDRRGVTIKLASERFIEYDQIGVVGTVRFDINNWNLGDGTTPGGMVSLNAE